MNLYNEIKKIIESLPKEKVADDFLKRLDEGKLTRDENPSSHFCVYFLPYNKREKKIFIGHHKKSGLWLSPGGHIDKDEAILDTLKREILEELGVENIVQDDIKPSMLTITPINNSIQPCKAHYDIWYFIHVDGIEFIIDQKEFYKTKWSSIDEARELISDTPNLRAIDYIEKNFFNQSML